MNHFGRISPPRTDRESNAPADAANRCRPPSLLPGSPGSHPRSNDLWSRVHALEGQKLYTLHSPRLFAVVWVDEESITVLPRSSKNIRVIPRHDLELVAAADVADSKLRKYVTGNLPHSDSASYIAAIAARIRS